MRLPRLDFAGARHHVMNRGARRQDVFEDDDARRLFLAVLAELPERFGVRIHGYALMPNHYHLLLESVTGDLPRAMRHLGGEFSRRLNLLHHWDGPLFRGRYHNRLVGTEAYWQHLLVYVHLNPQRAGLTETDPAAWTSHFAYLGDTQRPAWLTTEELQGQFGSRAAYLERFRAAAGGVLPDPSEFDPQRLWAPLSTGTVAIPDAREPLWAVADALEAFCAATGKTLDEVRTAPQGRRGNPANWLAAWWMSRRCGLNHGQIGTALGASHATISQRISKVEDRLETDPQIRSWVAALAKV
jgi:REP element-mobilizing transposase RayT